MKHLIVGYGNMGIKHANIFSKLGDTVHCIDIGIDPLKYLENHGEFDSVIIATPPNTHLDFIKLFKPSNVPLFCEKPVSTQLTNIDYPVLSMVACNWRFCPCVKSLRFGNMSKISISYPNATPLDLIHFLDLFWERYPQPSPQPEIKIKKYSSQHWQMSMQTPINTLEVFLSQGNKSTTINNVQIHELECDMFLNQAKSWREQLKHKQYQINSIECANIRTNALISALNASCSITNPNQNDLIDFFVDQMF